MPAHNTFFLFIVFSSHISHLNHSFLLAYTFFPLKSIQHYSSFLEPQISSGLIQLTSSKYGAGYYVYCSFGGYKHHTLGLQMEESHMQWTTPARFNGLATARWDSSVLSPQHFLWHSSIHKTEGEEVLSNIPPIHLFTNQHRHHHNYVFLLIMCCAINFQIRSNIPNKFGDAASYCIDRPRS